TAIVGPSGGGKSTVADVLIGLLAPDEGEVLVDGEPLTDAQRPAWRRRVAYVAQDVFLFHDTVRANLLLADPDADDARLWEALEAASAGFVKDLPDGLDTVVGDRGTRLSGGERQRLALARALLREPELLVLDEATSSLDAVNEARVQEAIRRLHGRTTMVVIAHRLATVRDADAIHVLVDGRITESGTWAELVGRPDGVFRNLAAAQGLAAGRGRGRSALAPGCRGSEARWHRDGAGLKRAGTGVERGGTDPSTAADDNTRRSRTSISMRLRVFTGGDSLRPGGRARGLRIS